MLSIIAAVGKNRELGYQGGLCFSLRGDMKYFKDITMGHKVVMGSKTLESLPGGALPGRDNYVLTHRPVDFPNATEINSLEKALELFKDTDEEVFVIGGASIYEQFLPYARKLYLTEVDGEATADVYFAEFDKNVYEREVVSEQEETERNSGKKLKYSFVVYTKKERL